MPFAVEPTLAAIMLQANPVSVLGSGWRSPSAPWTPARSALADAIRDALPVTRRLSWNVQNDLPPIVFAELLACRIRALGSAWMWRISAELEALLAAAGDEQC